MSASFPAPSAMWMDTMRRNSCPDIVSERLFAIIKSVLVSLGELGISSQMEDHFVPARFAGGSSACAKRDGARIRIDATAIALPIVFPPHMEVRP